MRRQRHGRYAAAVGRRTAAFVAVVGAVTGLVIGLLGGPVVDPTTGLLLVAVLGLGVTALGFGRIVQPARTLSPAIAGISRRIPPVVLAVEQSALRAQPRAPRAP